MAVKPVIGGLVQEFDFPCGQTMLMADAAGRQLYIIGPQSMSEQELQIFSDTAGTVHLGEGRAISYRATKWHPQVDDAYRGKKLTYEHQFGEEGGAKPQIWYNRSIERIEIRGGDYVVEGVGIRN